MGNLEWKVEQSRILEFWGIQQFEENLEIEEVQGNFSLLFYPTSPFRCRVRAGAPVRLVLLAVFQLNQHS